MRRLLSYINSHMYDIHAIIAGFVVVAIMMYLKAPIKKKIRTMVDAQVVKRPELLKKRNVMIRRWNSVLMLPVFLLSAVSFWALAVVSPFVSFSWQSSVMTGVFALCIYAVLEQVSESSEEEN